MKRSGNAHCKIRVLDAMKLLDDVFVVCFLLGRVGVGSVESNLVT